MLLLLVLGAPVVACLAAAAAVYDGVVRDSRRVERARGVVIELEARRVAVLDDVERAGLDGRLAVARGHLADLVAGHARRLATFPGVVVARGLKLDDPTAAAGLPSAG